MVATSESFSSSSVVSILHNHFVPSQIRPILLDSELSFHISRYPSFASEADILSICGLTLSLVVVPPDAFFHLSSCDGGEAVKLLHGSLGWVDQQSGGGVIERTRFPGAPGRAISMFVDCHEGLVRSGNDGAVFIRWRPLHLMDDDVSLRTLNVLPSYFPCDVREHVFTWSNVGGGGGDELDNGAHQRQNGGKSFRMHGFLVDFEEDGIIETIVRVNLAAAVPGRSLEFCSEYRDRGSQDSDVTTSVVCLSNTSGDGSITWTRNGAPFSSIVPLLHEFHHQSTSRMRWRPSKKTGSNDAKPDVIVLFDFLQSNTSLDHKTQPCIVS